MSTLLIDYQIIINKNLTTIEQGLFLLNLSFINYLAATQPVSTLLLIWKWFR